MHEPNKLAKKPFFFFFACCCCCGPERAVLPPAGDANVCCDASVCTLFPSLVAMATGTLLDSPADVEAYDLLVASSVVGVS